MKMQLLIIGITLLFLMACSTRGQTLTGEPVESFVLGDTEHWTVKVNGRGSGLFMIFEDGQVYSVAPKGADLETNLVVIINSDAYHYRLRSDSELKVSAELLSGPTE